MLDGIINDIEKDPYGRRKILSLWQENDLRETPGLAPCAFLTMWNVRGEYLDMTLIQRSGDMLTASGSGGINEVQYAAFHMMIARHTGYKPGVFVHFVQNEQIYDRHYDQAYELLKRYESLNTEENEGIVDVSKKVVDNPCIILNDTAKDSFKMGIEDFDIINYHPIRPQLKFELGI